MHRSIVLSLAFALAAPSAAQAFTTATTDDGVDLRWDTTDPVPFRFHYRGSDDLDTLELERLTRQAFATWAVVPTADVTMEEARIYTGPAAHHDGPSEVDGQSAIFFVEGLWPFGQEVIALTSVSFASDGQILDADIAFNGADHTFTTADVGGIKDFLSITTHEVGHFLGLAHPDPDVPTATMTAAYEDGATFLRDLDPDDEAGLAFLYPCGAPPCVGGVGWVTRRNGCDLGAVSVSPLGLGLVAGLLGLAVAGRRRRRRLAGPASAVLALLVLAPTTADSTLVDRIDIADLGAGAEQVVLADVVAVEAHLDGIVKRTVTLEVRERWAGAGPEQIELELLGGTLDEPVEVIGVDGQPLPQLLAGTKVFGSPTVAVGERIVALIDGDGVRGLAQGVFHVEEDRVWRDLSGLAFARTDRGTPVPVDAPDQLDDLRAVLAR